jgi:DNA mismatch repair protein MutS2
MAQAGLHIPAAPGSALPFFGSIFADIGDEQSIEQSLSTFSSHLTNIVGILAGCDRNSLVILDELGAGTDPVEGSALARAILEELRGRGATTCVATHYPELKSYAHHMPGAINASVEFDADTLAPTYRLTVGLPGRSNAFAIAGRLGLPEHVVEAAQGMVPPEVRQTEALLHDIQAQLQAAAGDRAAAATARTSAEARLKELNERLAQLDRERRDVLNAARAEARLQIKAVREELRRLRAEWAREPSTLAQLEAQTAAALDALEGRVAADVAPAAPAGPAYRGPLQPGDQVWVAPLNALGEVISSRRGEVEVQLGHFRTTVRRSQLELRGQAAAKEAAGAARGASEVAGLSLPAAESPGLELDLRGQTSEEALRELDRFLDEAYLAGLPWVRIIHGKGSGVLRAAVRDALKNHPLVSAYQSGEDAEGGEGVTVVRLASEK